MDAERVVRRGLALVLGGFMAAAMLVGYSSSAWAQASEPSFDLQIFRPATGAQGFLGVRGGGLNKHLAVNAGLMAVYARSPLGIQVVGSGGSQSSAGLVVENRFDANFYASLGLFEYAEIGLLVPVVYQGGLQNQSLDDASIGLGITELKPISQGDLRFNVRGGYAFFEGALSIAAGVTIVAPTAGSPAFAGEKSLVWEPELGISGKVGPMRLGLDVGYRIREGVEVQALVVDDELFGRLAIAYGIPISRGNDIEIIGELHGHTAADRPFGSGVDDGDTAQAVFERARTTLEGEAGVRVRIAGAFVVSGGIGGGFVPGYGAAAPRVMAGFAYDMGGVLAEDRDEDGVPDAEDACLDEPEDIDQFEDEDGCPEPDNDGDLVLDEDDLCPLEKEDRDGFGDDDGCPEIDNDEDGIEDTQDACPADAEDKDGFEDEDGCPEADNDGDGIDDVNDGCLDEKEDVDGFKDGDGCPEVDNDEDGLSDLNDLCPNRAEDIDQVEDDDGCPEDNDKDGLADPKDQCVNRAETYNGVKDSDGCPEKRKRPLVRLDDDTILLLQPLVFRGKSSELIGKGQDILKALAALLQNATHLKLIRIEGHTGADLSRRRALELSRARASKIRQSLIRLGVAGRRLDALGVGLDRPLVRNAKQNHRIELLVVEQEPLGVDVAAAASEAEIEIDIDVGADTPAEPSGDDAEIVIDVGGEADATPSPSPSEESSGDIDIQLDF